MPDFKRFYNPYRLMAMKDKNGEKPEIYISVGNRGGGKTYGFSYMFVDEFLKNDKKIVLLCRYQREVGTVAKGIFEEVLRQEFPAYTITEQVMAKGVFSNIFLECDDGSGEEDAKQKKHFGYVIPINSADAIKKLSSLFADAYWMFFDEFQCASMTSYCPDEVDKFLSVHISVARGGGKASRFCPVIMLSNANSIVNPYFVALDMSNKIMPNTRKLKLDGLVFERFINPHAAKAQKESAFNRAFGKSRTLDSSIDNTWLNDNESGICKPSKEWGRSIYYYTIVYKDKKFGVRFYPAVGFYYLSKSVDTTCQYVYAFTIEDKLNIPLIRKSTQGALMREAIFNGQMRFADHQCKQIVLDLFI